MTSNEAKPKFDSKAYSKKYYHEKRKVECVCPDCFKIFATPQSMKKHQETNQKCLIIKLKQQITENTVIHSDNSTDNSTIFSMSDESDVYYNQEPELKSYSVFNYII